MQNFIFQLQETVDSILARGWTVCHLMQAIRNYCLTSFDIMEQSTTDSIDLLNALLLDECYKNTNF